MKITVRTWSLTHEGQRCILETVEIAQSIYDSMQVWAYKRKEPFLQRKYASNEAVRNTIWDRLNQEFNQFMRTLPDLYRRNTPENMAISYLYSLYTDNPELLPDEIEVKSKNYQGINALT